MEGELQARDITIAALKVIRHLYQRLNEQLSLTVPSFLFTFPHICVSADVMCYVISLSVIPVD